MHPSELDRIRKEIWRLALAEHDMHLAVVAAQDLAQEGPSEVLEAALAVIYCRPFSGPPRKGKEARHIVDELAPRDEVSLRLWELRDKLFAHTDKAYRFRRKVVDVFGNHSHQVEYRHLNPDVAVVVEALARERADRFKTEREKRETRLREAGVDPTPYPTEWVED